MPAVVHNVCEKSWRCTHKAVHKQHKAHSTWPLATAEVTLVEGGVPVLAMGETTRVWTGASRDAQCVSETLTMHTQEGANARWCTQKAVYTQSTTHTRRFVATAEVLKFKGGAGK